MGGSVSPVPHIMTTPYQQDSGAELLNEVLLHAVSSEQVCVTCVDGFPSQLSTV